MGSSSVTPAPPEGFVPVDQASSVPPPPPGFVPVGPSVVASQKAAGAPALQKPKTAPSQASIDEDVRQGEEQFTGGAPAAGAIVGATLAAPLTAGLSLLGAAGVMGGAAAAGSVPGQLMDGGKVTTKETTKQAVLGAAGAVGGKALEAISNIPKNMFASRALKEAAAAAPSAETTAAAEAAIPAKASAEELHAPVISRMSDRIHDALDAAASDAGINLPADAGRSISAKATSLSDAVGAKGKAIYQKLDQAFEGKFQRFQDTIQDLKDTIYENAHVNPKVAKAAQTQLKDQISLYDEFKQFAVSKGANASDINVADAAWNQKMALKDFAKKAKVAELLGGELKPTGSVSSMNTSIKNLGDPRLEQALGKRAVNVRQAVMDANSELRQAASANRASVEAAKSTKAAAKASVSQTKSQAASAQARLDQIRANQKTAIALGAGAAGIGAVVKGASLAKSLAGKPNE